MILANFSQPKLVRHMEILVDNGPLPQAQAVIGPVGYDPDGLDEGRTLLMTWLEHRKLAQALMLVQKQSTAAQNRARSEAKRMVGLFTKTVETLFAEDEAALRTLGVRPRARRKKSKYRSRQGDQDQVEDGDNETETKQKGESQSTAATIFRWRRRLANVDHLDDEHKEQLAAAGWTAERIAEAAALVEAFASADTKQQEAIRAQQAQQATAKAAEISLRKWYRDARKLIGLAIDEADPQNQDKLRELLGLND